MAIKGIVSRRSFLSRVAGTAIASGSLGIVTGCATTRPTTPATPSGLTDTDSGANIDPAGNGRGNPDAEPVTDKDAGAGADLAGHGRDVAPVGAGYVDRDYGSFQDSVPCGGRRPRYTGVTDTDAGEAADRANWGRGFNLGEPDKAGINSPAKCLPPRRSVTDSDIGSRADPVGEGRGGS